MSQRPALAGRRGISALAGNKMSGVAQRQRIEDMEGTLVRMHEVLKQMRANAAKSHAKDPLAKANLDMWELMVGHLDKQLEELKVAMATREDVEARRAAMYQQADAKAKAQAAQAAARAVQVAPGASAGQSPTPTPATQGAEQSTAGQTPADQTPAALPPHN